MYLLFLVAISAFVFVGGMVFFESSAFAQVDVGVEVGEETGLAGTDPRIILGRIIQIALGFLGIAAIALVVYAGYLWMTSAGNPELVERAKTILRNGIIGLIIIVSAFGIVTFVLNLLGGATGISGLPTTQPGTPFISGGGGFPIGVIESHYPDRGQRNVARNTNIFVSFVEPMQLESLVDDNGTPGDTSDDLIHSQNIRIVRSEDSLTDGPFVPARAALSEDLRTVVIDPVDFLGSADENTNYTVLLGEGISTFAGRPAFGNFGAYQWEFEVGTFIDLDPPYIDNVFPVEGSTHPRNVVIQINFNEAMNPLTSAGDTSRGFDNIIVRTSSGETVQGTFQISNQYSTVEFITDDLCGVNSCGEDIFCLPGQSEISVELRAATVSQSPPTAAFPPDGLTDAASNSLDGNIDGVAEGSPADDYTWYFNTTNQIDLTAPLIESVTPEPFATLVPLDEPVRALFSKPIMFKTINRQNVQIQDSDINITSTTENSKSTIRIQHPPFGEDTTYTPIFSSGIRDLYQNCYNPCVGP